MSLFQCMCRNGLIEMDITRSEEIAVNYNYGKSDDKKKLWIGVILIFRK
jgi:hypothetical protein